MRIVFDPHVERLYIIGLLGCLPGDLLDDCQQIV